jgi:hypothetical protein
MDKATHTLRRPWPNSFDVQKTAFQSLDGSAILNPTLMRTFHPSFFAASLAFSAFAGDAAVIEKTPGLVGFFTFGEDAGQQRHQAADIGSI